MITRLKDYGDIRNIYSAVVLVQWFRNILVGAATLLLILGSSNPNDYLDDGVGLVIIMQIDNFFMAFPTLQTMLNEVSQDPKLLQAYQSIVNYLVVNQMIVF